MGKKRASTRLADFTPGQLEALAACYPILQDELYGLAADGLTTIMLPDAVSDEDRLAVLKALEATGDLWIRISYAGNLNVWVRESPDLHLERGQDDGIGYLAVLRRPATTSCIPHGRYYP